MGLDKVMPVAVSLPSRLEVLIRRKVESGEYVSANEVVHEALLLLEARDQSRAERLAALRADIQQGLDEADRGDVVDGEAVFQRLLAKCDRPSDR